MNADRRMRAHTLLEVLIAMTVGLLVLAAAGALYHAQRVAAARGRRVPDARCGGHRTDADRPADPDGRISAARFGRCLVVATRVRLFDGAREGRGCAGTVRVGARCVGRFADPVCRRCRVDVAHRQRPSVGLPRAGCRRVRRTCAGGEPMCTPVRRCAHQSVDGRARTVLRKRPSGQASRSCRESISCGCAIFAAAARSSSRPTPCAATTGAMSWPCMSACGRAANRRASRCGTSTATAVLSSRKTAARV